MIQYTKFNAFLWIILFFVWHLPAQIPNAGFENWTNGSPDSWLTNNAPPTVIPITQSNTSHSGSFAVRGEVIDFSGFGVGPSMTTSDPQGNNIGFPVSQRYAQLSGWYQFNKSGTSLLVITIFIGHLSSSDTTGVGVGSFVTDVSAGSYTQFTAPINYVPGTPEPNLAWITVQLTDSVSGFPAAGDYFLLDDLSLSGVVGFDDLSENPVPGEYELYQNYPNPFNPSTNISFNLPEVSDVEITIYNQLGEVVDRIIPGQLQKGKHTVKWNADNQPSGIYYYQMKTGDQKLTRKMMLVR